VSLKIYNVLGQEVMTLIDDPRPAGFWSVEWDGRDTAGNSVASGVYIYRLEAAGFSGSKKLVIVR
jgi:flagellar hook assembly protein FlgD